MSIELLLFGLGVLALGTGILLAAIFGLDIRLHQKPPD